MHRVRGSSELVRKGSVVTDETVITPCVYVLCFARTPYKHARHYLGMTVLPIADRVARHRTGRGARLLRQVLDNGGDFELADTWDCATAEEARTFERVLKRQGGGSRCCSICNPGNGRGAGRGRNRFGVNPQSR